MTGLIIDLYSAIRS